MLAKYVPKASISPLKEKNLPENPPAMPAADARADGGQVRGRNSKAFFMQDVLRVFQAFSLTCKLFHVTEINLQIIGRVRERMFISRGNSTRMAGVNHQLPHMQDQRGQ